MFSFLKSLFSASEKSKRLVENGLAQMKEHNMEEALNDFNEAINKDPNNADAFYNRGILMNDKGKIKDAIKDFNEAVRINPSHARAFSNRGVIKYHMGRLYDAIIDYNRAISLNPSYAVTYNNRGNIRYNLEKYEDALADYAEAVRLKPNYPKAHYNLGKARIKVGQRKEAISDLDHAIKLDPKNMKAYYYRGNAKMAIGEYKDSIGDFDNAIKLSSRFADAYYNRANAKNKSGMKEEALIDFTEVIDIDPKNAKAFYSRGNVHFSLKKYKEAVVDYNLAIKRDPNLVWAYYGRSTALIANGEKKKGIVDMEKFVQLTENSISEGSSVRDEALKYLEMLKNPAGESTKSQKPAQIVREKMPDELETPTDNVKRNSAIKDMRFESILYIDIADSTVIIDQFGEVHFNRMISAIQGPLDEFKGKYGCKYQKSTGDGWMLTFDRCVDAVSFSTHFFKAVRQYNSKASNDLKVVMRIGIDCGQVLIRGDMDRCGDAANVAKRIEGISKSAFVELADEMKNGFPAQDRIFISAKVFMMVKERKEIQCRTVGWAELKGKAGMRFLLFEVIWQ